VDVRRVNLGIVEARLLAASGVQVSLGYVLDLNRVPVFNENIKMTFV
jgi:hypothetical protein